MNTVKLHVPYTKFKDVMKSIKENRVKYYPIRRVLGGYRFEIEDCSTVSYLMLKYDLNLSIDVPTQ